MADSKDVLAGEVSVAAKLDETGLTAKTKSRAITALDRLLGSAIDIPGAWFEGVSRSIRQRNQIRESMLEVDAKAAVRQLHEYSAVGERTFRVFLEDQERKQRNRDAVASQFVDEVMQIPDHGENSMDGSAEDDRAERLDEDWLNVLSSHAENATSEHLRALWARILAGEVRQPRSFSLTTLRMASELDRDIADIFQRKVADRLHDGYLPKSNNLSGQELLDLVFLEEVGLLQDVNGLVLKLEVGDDGSAHLVNGKMALKFRMTNSISIPVARITRVGRELASILPSEPDDHSLRVVAALVRPQVQNIELCEILAYKPDGSRQIRVIAAL